MSRLGPGTVVVLSLLVALTFLLALFLPIAHAAEQLTLSQPPLQEVAVPAAASAPRFEEVGLAARAPAAVSTTLEVAVLSSPHAVRDNQAHLGPRVFVVHGVVTNTGAVTATDLLVNLDYQEDPANDWVLAPGEDPDRTPRQLAPGEAYHAYWFATYTSTLDATHQYTVSALAANADPVSTGATVTTARFNPTERSDQFSFTSEIVVGVGFSLLVDYKLGQGPEALIFSPGGNLDFDAGLLRLTGVSVRFHDDNGNQKIVSDRIYFDSIPLLAGNVEPTWAEVTYHLLPLAPGENTLCPYLGIDYGGPIGQYDNDYCTDDGSTDTIVNLPGVLSTELSKEASAPLIQEGERLTYTLRYTDTGTVALQQVWVWDDVDPSLGQILTSTISPAPDETESNASRVAWDLDDVLPGEGGTLSFAFLVDGGTDQDLADGQIIVNNAFFGINEGSLPATIATTDTITSTVVAPTVVGTHSDGPDTATQSQPLTYTLTIQNQGSLTATALSATDLLPAYVSLAGATSPPLSSQSGQTLTWDDLGDLAPGAGLTVTVPVRISADAPHLAALTNEFFLNYHNPAGHLYQPLYLTDTTTVERASAWVEGYVFVDDNGNGVFDGGESGLDGVQLSLPGAVSPTLTTAADGFYRFRVEAEGTHTLTAADLPGYTSTTPNRVAVDLAFDQTVRVDFGDRLAGTGPAVIYGTVFSDDNGNGEWDGTEAGLPGVDVALDDNPPVSTDAFGRYNFVGVSPGLHTVQETDPDTYTSTTPNRVAVAVDPAGSYEVNFGDMPPATGAAAIYGTVFSDDNGNGEWDLDEGTLRGVTVTLGTLEVTTDDYGRYYFGALAAGFHTVVETDPDGYTSTTPNHVAVAVELNQSYEINFGDMPPGSGFAAVYGTVFSDDNGNSRWDDGEPGIPGVTVALDGSTTTTDPYGRYNFGAVPAGLHNVEETDPANYTSTTPNRVAVAVELNQSYEINFGDMPAAAGAAAVYGTVFSDDDGNGAWDDGEPGIPNVTVALDGNATTTDAYGRYTFGAVTAGSHAVVETDPPNHTSTTLNQVLVDVALGQTYEVNFGDMPTAGPPPAVIYGTVFSDDDGDGTRDAGEPGLPDVAVALDGLEVRTDAYGRYTFGAVLTGTRTLRETDPEGYTSTTANQVAVPVEAGQSYVVDFGDMLADGTSAAIYGTVFADADGNGHWDDGEQGIPNVYVALDGAPPVSTDAYGRYTFGAVAPGVHTVLETDLVGYTSTTPNQVVVAAQADGAYAVNFGDMLADGTLAVVYGTVYADADGNGHWDDGEAGIPNVTVALDGDATTTDAYGRYTFGAVLTGTHTLQETDPDGYISTTPNRVAVTATAGQVDVVDFGDMPADGTSAAIYGTVFADEDGDTVWDPGEAGIAGVSVSLDDDTPVLTDKYGRYTFGAVVAGQHTLVETDLPGYVSTTPNTVELTAVADNAYVQNFGDVMLGTGSCLPDLFEDDDGPESARPLAEGIVASHDFCDEDTADWHALSFEAGDTYTITTNAFGLRADTVLALFSADGQTLLAANDDFAGTTNFSSQIVWHATTSGTYLLRISNRGALAEWLTTYEVWVERQAESYLFLPIVQLSAGGGRQAETPAPFARSRPKLAAPAPNAPAGVIDHCGPDAFEVDDTWEQAAAVLPGVPQTHNFDSNPDQYAPDKDFVFFEVGPAGSFSASVTSTSTTTLLELYDEQGQALPVSGVGAVQWNDMPLGRYYLSVSPVPPAYSCDGSVDYELTVDYTRLYRTLLPVVVGQ